MISRSYGKSRDRRLALPTTWGLRTTYEKLHLGDFLVHLLHELDDEINQLVLQHLFGVRVGDQERDIIALGEVRKLLARRGSWAYLDWLSSQDEEGFGSLSEKACELMDEDVLDLVRLLDLDADPDAVDARFDEDSLIFVARDGERIQQHFGRACGFDLWHIMPF